MPKLPESTTLVSNLSAGLSLSPALRLLAPRSTALKTILLTVSGLIPLPPPRPLPQSCVRFPRRFVPRVCSWCPLVHWLDRRSCASRQKVLRTAPRLRPEDACAHPGRNGGAAHRSEPPAAP